MPFLIRDLNNGESMQIPGDSAYLLEVARKAKAFDTMVTCLLFIQDDAETIRREGTQLALNKAMLQISILLSETERFVAGDANACGPNETMASRYPVSE